MFFILVINMVNETILQHWIITQFALPFLLIFAIVYAVLEKTKILGDNHQVNAIIGGVIGLVFVSALSPKRVVENLILFFTVAIVVIFIVLLLWGFVAGTKDKDKGFELDDWMKYTLWAISGIAVIVAIIWATGLSPDVLDFLFDQSWSGEFWTNFFFVAVVIVALVVILKNKSD